MQGDAEIVQAENLLAGILTELKMRQILEQQ